MKQCLQSTHQSDRLLLARRSRGDFLQLVTSVFTGTRHPQANTHSHFLVILPGPFTTPLLIPGFGVKVCTSLEARIDFPWEPS